VRSFALFEQFDRFLQPIQSGLFFFAVTDPAAVFLAMGRAQRSEKRKQPFPLQSFFQFSRNLQRSRSIVSPDLDVKRVAWSCSRIAFTTASM
jgi:hypothetical protein